MSINVFSNIIWSHLAINGESKLILSEIRKMAGDLWERESKGTWEECNQVMENYFEPTELEEMGIWISLSEVSVEHPLQNLFPPSCFSFAYTLFYAQNSKYMTCENRYFQGLQPLGNGFYRWMWNYAEFAIENVTNIVLHRLR